MKTPIILALLFFAFPVNSMAKDEAKCCVYVDAGWSFGDPKIHVDKMDKTFCEKLPGYSKSYFEDDCSNTNKELIEQFKKEFKKDN